MTSHTAAAPPSTDGLPPHSDNVEEELGRVQLALESVFSPHQQSNEMWQGRQLADRYLTSFQSTRVSWMVCDKLLQSNTKENQQWFFFAAQTLHTKCRCDVHQLPAESLPSLRDSLLQHLSNHALSNNTALLTRLALAIAALAVQMSWTSIVHDLLSAPSPTRLEIIRVLPEECASERLVLENENLRYKMRDSLVASCPQVLQYCQSLHNNNKVFSVWHTWIKHVPIPPSIILQTTILQTAIQAVPREEAAVDVLEEVMKLYPSHVAANHDLIQTLVPLMLSLRPAFDDAISQQQQDEDDDDAALRGYCRLVTEMAEGCLSFILSKQHYAQASKLVEWVLRCSCIRSKEIATMTLHFWYRFVMDLEAMENYTTRQEIVDAYTPLLLELLGVCVNHLLKYPSDLDELPQDMVEDIHRERYYVVETIQDCCRLLGGNVVLEQLTRGLQQEYNRVGASLLESTTDSWQGVESCLYGIQSIHMFVPNDETKCLPFCMELLVKLPPNISPLRFTASLTIGKYAPWLALNSQYMQPLLPLLAQGLSIPKCSTAAAVAIKQLCEHSDPTIVSLGVAVLQLYQELMTTPQEQRIVQVGDELEILEGVCKALSRQLQQDPSSATSYLTQIVQPIGTRLYQLLSQTTNAPVRQVVAEVERLTVVCRYWRVPTNPNDTTATHPTLEIVKSSWSLLESATQRYPHDVLLAEKICRFHKHALRTCGATVYAPMLDSLLHQLVASFEITNQSPYLYCTSICITEYARDALYTQRLLDAVAALAKTAFGVLQDFDKMTAHPDVVEELFYLMGRAVSYCGNSFLTNTSLLVSLFQCAVVGMRLHHRDANRGTLHFLETTVGYGVDMLDGLDKGGNTAAVMSSLEQALSQEGQAVVNGLVGALVGDLPAYSIDNGNGSIAGILWKMHLLCGERFQGWIVTALAAAPERPKTEFLASGFLNHSLNPTEFNTVVRGFVSACDRYRKLRRN